jgi:hypothetical protein
VVVVDGPCPAASAGSAIAAANVAPAAASEMRLVPLTRAILAGGHGEFRNNCYGTSRARSARTGIANRSAVTTASHAAWIRIWTASGPVARPRVISTRW